MTRNPSPAGRASKAWTIVARRGDPAQSLLALWRAMSTENTPSALRDAVRHFEVCWDVFPELSTANHVRTQIGFTVELYGTNHLRGVVPTAGCKHCIPVLRALLAIADFVVPDAWRQALSAVRAHSSIEYAKERGERPDIVVAITMLPPGEGPADDRNTQCLAAVKARLQQLGASERSWRSGDHPADGT
jgi:hypothetical protein